MLWWLGQNLVVAAVLAGLVALGCRLARPRPALRHALWLLVLVKLLTPPVVYWPWPVPDLSRYLQSQTGAMGPTSAVESKEYLASHWDGILALGSVEAPGQASALGEAPSVSAAESSWVQTALAWLSACALGLWCTGTLAVAGLQVLRIRRFRALLERAQWPPRWLKQQVRELARLMEVRRPRTQVVPQIESPSVWSLGRPRLLWPEALLDTLPAFCRRSVVAHELAHLRRRDHWVGWLILAAECLWWWNPLFWYVRRQIRASAEMACDAWVVQTLPEDRRAYAEALLEVTQLVSRTAAPVPAVGMSTGARHLFERRLTMIMHEPVSCRLSVAGLAGLAVLAFLVLPGWSLVQTARADDPKEQPKAKPELQKIVVWQPETWQPELQKIPETFVFKWSDNKSEGQADKSPDAERERRLRALEEQIESLLKEVKALRGDEAKGKHQVKTDTVKAGPKGFRVHVIEDKQGTVQYLLAAPQVEKLLEVRPVEPKKGEIRLWKAVPDQKGEKPDQKGKPELSKTTLERGVHYLNLRVENDRNEPITLVRATYRLPHDKAEALASLLGQLVKAPVLETKVDGDVLTVTTTPESQKAIRALIGLIEGQKSASRENLKPIELKWDEVMPSFQRVLQLDNKDLKPLDKTQQPPEKVNAIELKLETGKLKLETDKAKK